jgi:GR25 family glycosyltransferase involved in LPS biosynthesis
MYQIISRFLIPVLLFISWSLEGGVEKYFKKADNKPDFRSIRNIDFIYMLNLDKRPDKYLIASKELERYSIHPYRFSAVNGWELTNEDLLEIGVKYNTGMTKELWGTYYPLDSQGPVHEVMHVSGRTYFSHCMSKGAIGCFLSHCSILQDAYDAGYETVWVMEDDIQVFSNPHDVSALIDRLDRLTHGKWDILFTDPDTKNNNGDYVPCRFSAPLPNYIAKNTKRFKENRILSRDFKKIGTRFGTYSMVIRRSGMRKILNFVKAHNVFLPYDMTFFLPEDIQIFGLNYDFVSTKPNSSSNNGIPP